MPDDQELAPLPTRFLSYAIDRLRGRLSCRDALFELLRPMVVQQHKSKLLTAQYILRRIQGRADTTKAWMTNLCEYLDAPVTARARGEVKSILGELIVLIEPREEECILGNLIGLMEWRGADRQTESEELAAILAGERCFLSQDFAVPHVQWVSVPHVQWVSGFHGLRPKTRIALMDLVLPAGFSVEAVEARRRIINQPYAQTAPDPADPDPPQFFCIFGANPISLDWLRYCRSLGAEVRSDMRLYGNNLLVETCIDADDLPAEDLVPTLRLLLGACAFDLADLGYDSFGVNAPAVAHLAKHPGIPAEAFELVLGGASPDAEWTFSPTLNDCTLLNYAANHGGSVSGLLAVRPPPQVDKLDGSEFTPLETVLFCCPHLENAAALLDAGADLSKEMVEEEMTVGEYLERNEDNDPIFVAIAAHVESRKRAREGAAAAPESKSART